MSFALMTVPGLRVVWDNLAADTKRLWVLALCLIAPLAGVVSACYGYNLHMGAFCPPDGITAQSVIDLLFDGALAYVGMKGAYAFGASMLEDLPDYEA